MDIQENKFCIQNEEFELNELLEECLVTQFDQCKDKEIEIEMKHDINIKKICSDYNRIKQVLMNFINLSIVRANQNTQIQLVSTLIDTKVIKISVKSSENLFGRQNTQEVEELIKIHNIILLENNQQLDVNLFVNMNLTKKLSNRMLMEIKNGQNFGTELHFYILNKPAGELTKKHKYSEYEQLIFGQKFEFTSSQNNQLKQIISSNSINDNQNKVLKNQKSQLSSKISKSFSKLYQEQRSKYLSFQQSLSLMSQGQLQEGEGGLLNKIKENKYESEQSGGHYEQKMSMISMQSMGQLIIRSSQQICEKDIQANQDLNDNLYSEISQKSFHAQSCDIQDSERSNSIQPQSFVPNKFMRCECPFILIIDNNMNSKNDLMCKLEMLSILQYQVLQNTQEMVDVINNRNSYKCCSFFKLIMINFSLIGTVTFQLVNQIRECLNAMGINNKQYHIIVYNENQATLNQQKCLELQIEPLQYPFKKEQLQKILDMY